MKTHKSLKRKKLKENSAFPICFPSERAFTTSLAERKAAACWLHYRCRHAFCLEGAWAQHVPLVGESPCLARVSFRLVNLLMCKPCFKSIQTTPQSNSTWQLLSTIKNLLTLKGKLWLKNKHWEGMVSKDTGQLRVEASTLTCLTVSVNRSVLRVIIQVAFSMCSV